MDVHGMVQQWDNGDAVWSVAMGGLGPGYEQAIQVLIVELVRDHKDAPLDRAVETDPAAWSSWGDATVSRVNAWPGCGFSGAQAGAAKNVAYRMLRDGYEAFLSVARAEAVDRMIQISRTWPRAPESVGAR